MGDTLFPARPSHTPYRVGGVIRPRGSRDVDVSIFHLQTQILNRRETQMIRTKLFAEFRPRVFPSARHQSRAQRCCAASYCKTISKVICGRRSLLVLHLLFMHICMYSYVFNLRFSFSIVHAFCSMQNDTLCPSPESRLNPAYQLTQLEPQ